MLFIMNLKKKTLSKPEITPSEEYGELFFALHWCYSLQLSGR